MRIYAKPPGINVMSSAKSSIARYLTTEQAMAFERNGIGIASGSPSAEAGLLQNSKARNGLWRRPSGSNL
jgi:hypothetical protein